MGETAFGGVPVEIFVNPPSWIEWAFETDRERGQPAMAHMVATGFAVYDAGGGLEHLHARASEVLAGGPRPSPERLTQLRYGTVDALENALAEVIKEGKSVTYDLKERRDDPTAVGTSQMADAIIRAMEK